MKNIAECYSNKGYPFTYLYLDSIKYKNDSIEAKLICNYGSIVKIDTIINKGNLIINNDILSSLIGISKKDIYNEEKIKNISISTKNQ